MSCEKQVDENLEGIIIAIGAGNAEAQPYGKKKAYEKTITQRQHGYELWPVDFVFVGQQAAEQFTEGTGRAKLAAKERTEPQRGYGEQQAKDQRNRTGIKPLASDDVCERDAGTGNVNRAEAGICDKGACELVEKHERFVEKHETEHVTGGAFEVVSQVLHGVSSVFSL